MRPGFLLNTTACGAACLPRISQLPNCGPDRNPFQRASNMQRMFTLIAISTFALSLPATNLRAGTPQPASRPSSAPPTPNAQAFVPGTGTFLDKLCDDFEDSAWSYTYNQPKS